MRTLEWTGDVRLAVSQPEKADDDEEVDDLLRVALYVEYERECDGERGTKNDNDLQASIRLPVSVY